MVISDKNRYVFVEVPQTASSAIAAELVEHYDGRRIYRKHTDYSEFFRSASTREKGYSVLAAVRNPLDIVVSKFTKARDDHHNRYAGSVKENVPWGHRFRPEAREFAFLARRGPDFSAYVRRFYPRIYNSRACLLPSHAHVMKFEDLNEGLSNWLQERGLEMVRPLPWRHPTGGRLRDFASSYDGGLQEHAARVFGPFMRRWGYEFPAGWPASKSLRRDELIFKIDSAVRRFYFRRIHYGLIMPKATREHRVDRA